MQIEHIFSNFLTHEKINVDNELIKHICLEIKQKDAGRIVSNNLGYQSNDLDLKKMPELFDTIQNKLDLLKDHLGMKKNYFLKLDNAWININEKYSSNIPHSHPESIISGVYYVSADKDSGDIVFDNPNTNLKYHIDKKHIDNYNFLNCETWHATPLTGTLLMFPSWLVHRVNQNLSDEPRISIAFNALIK